MSCQLILTTIATASNLEFALWERYSFQTVVQGCARLFLPMKTVANLLES